MAHIDLLDTFPMFLAFWRKARCLPVEEQITRWAQEHMTAWPELLAKQIDDYEGQGEDWRRTAAERVFPFLDERLADMRTAHANLRSACGPLYLRAQERLGFEDEAIFILHVGIGCGAGWATTYERRPAILFGLENIAECGWIAPPALTGLIAHEVGHLAHFHWRSQGNKSLGSGPWWQLYEEGFAQRCEHLILGSESWRMNQHGEGDWLAWCQEHRQWLAAQFLRAADEGASVRPFFGSWYRLEGRSQTGYYLGHELVRGLEAHMDVREIALLDSDDPRLRAGLVNLAEGRA